VVIRRRVVAVIRPTVNCRATIYMIAHVPRAFVIGGTGATGRAIALRLLRRGWDVDVTGREPDHIPAALSELGGRFVQAQRADAGRLSAALGEGADLLVDCVCYTATDAMSLLQLARRSSSTVMLSTKAVYVDGAGHHSNSPVAPRFDGPIRETQSTVAPGGGDFDTPEGYGANKVAAEQALLDSGLPVTVLRPSKIHGAGAARPREWVFVKRVLDGRRVVVLAGRGRGVDHTTAAANIAALVETVAAKPGRRVLNSADPDAPSALEIARTIARHLDHDWDEVLLDGDAVGTVGRHPWDVPYPIVLDTSAALELGYAPVGDYASTVAEEVDWLVSAARGGDGLGKLPGADDPFFAPLLDYAAEDRYLARGDPARNVTPG
jgi:nucleoside-diphosphate-sugar epimerase